MAQRRMFSKRITNSGRFLKMPITSQALYFHLNMHADDDGVVEAFQVMRMTGFSEDDLRVLATRSFIKVLNEDLVTFVMDWREHNLIRADRKVDSIYKDLLLQIVDEVDVLDPKPRADTGHLTGGRPLDNQMSAQVRIGKVRIGKVRIEDATALKESFFNNPLMESLKLSFPDRDYDLEFDLMVDWWSKNKKTLPLNISAFKNWLAYTKPNKQLNTRIIREKK